MKHLTVYIFVVCLQLVYGGRVFDIAPRFTPGACDAGVSNVCVTCNKIGKCAFFEAIPTPSKTECPKDTPYCVARGFTAFCSKTTTNDECKEGAGLKCGSLGYHPNPQNCGQFLYCAAVNGAAPLEEIGTCRTGFVFDEKSLNGYCRKAVPSVAADCPKINCTVSGYFSYGKTPNKYYIYCHVETNKIQYYMFSCPDQMKYDKDQEMCVIDCVESGDRLPYPGTVDQYFECYRDVLPNGPLKFDVRTCIRGTLYDASLKMCTS